MLVISPLLLLPLLLLLGPSRRCAVVLGAPAAGREVYRMPQNTLRALSERGTVVLEAALTSALSTLERATSERSRAETTCRDCVPCLFQDCGQRSTSCSSPSRASSEPSCDVISKAQKIPDEGERSWALSQACGFYQRRCQPADLDRESCIRVMGESCSARVLQCSLLNTMQNLEPATQTRTQALCGQRSSPVQNVTQPRSRIVGGSPASPGSWPWLVNLQLDGGLMCGGVLVDSSWVVTAAHCFAGSRSESYWTAVMGEFDITKTDPDEQVLKVNRIITHPKFNPKTFNNDIALVELTSPVVLSERVTPVCLPSDMDPPTGSPCLVAGWGSLFEDGPSADVVMEAKVPLLPQSTCKSTLGKDLVTNTMLCAGYLSGGIDSCQGDSGGPLIYQDRTSGRFQLYGITSWGDGCGEKGKPGVYTRVTAFSDWIQAEIQKSFGSREPTCSELLKTTEMSEEEQRSEFSSLCRFYAVTCPPGQSVSSCNHMAEEKCLTRFKKCQLRSFLQTLLDLLQRAEDYIRDKVDLTFFTQTLPQLVEHIYSTAFAHTRDRRDLGGLLARTRDRRDLLARTRDRRDLLARTRDHRDLLARTRDRRDLLARTHTAEQLGGAVGSEERRPPPALPVLFKEVGPLVEDWEKYLTGLADNLDQQPAHSTTPSTPLRREENLFLQAAEPSLHQLEGQYQSVISSLRSKLDSKPAPPMLHLDTVSFLQDPPYTSGTPNPADPSSSSSFEDFHAPDSSLTILISEIQKMNKQEGTSAGAGETRKSETSASDANGSLDGTPSASEAPSPSVAVPATAGVDRPGPGGPEGDRLMTTSSTPALGGLFPRQALRLHRRRRRSPLLRKRQIPGSNGKVCAVVTESSQRVNQVQDSYRWVLGIPTKNLHMTFQEVLVDLSSKNDRGLYEARVRVLVGGRPLTFYSLVGLENESFYRSMPRIIALALDGLKT